MGITSISGGLMVLQIFGTKASLEKMMKTMRWQEENSCQHFKGGRRELTMRGLGRRS